MDELNIYLVENDTISPNQDYNPKNFKLTKADVDSLLKDNENVENGKVPGYLLNTYVQAHIDRLLDKVLNHKSIVEYNLKDILKMGVTVSTDNKLFSLSYDANTGGSYKSSFSRIHYRPGNGQALNFSSSNEGIGDQVDFNSDGYDSIDIMMTNEGVKYLLSGSVTGCNTCTGEYLQLVHFEKGKPIFDFSYSISRRMDDEAQSITYDIKHKLIVVEHNPESDSDGHSGCDCNTDDARAKLSRGSDSGWGTEGIPNISSTLKTGKKLKCIFYFNGKTFTLNRKMSRMPE